MVGPFLEVSLIEDSALRDTTIPIFVDMMTCEFYSKTPSGEKQDFGLVSSINFLSFADSVIFVIYLVRE